MSQHQPPKHVIFAGDFEQARNFAINQGFAPFSWTFADSERKVRARNPQAILIYKVGTWHENRKVVEAFEAYEQRKALYLASQPNDPLSSQDKGNE